MDAVTKGSRIESIDLLRGIVMVLMALDHARYFLHQGSTMYVPTDMENTTPILFFTRFITHFCAPVFVFLAGTSASLYGAKRTKKELFKYLFSRGLWLIILEIILNDFIWFFDLDFEFIQLQVIWAIGFSMICLSIVSFLPNKIILVIGIIIVAGHNLLDGISMEGNNMKSIIWYILHQESIFPIGEIRMLRVSYPLLPWIGVMMLGYCFGTLYKKGFDISLRKKWLIGIGLGATVLFFILRLLNVYGDPNPWIRNEYFIQSFLSFLNVTKYPASLAFLLVTLGPPIIFLATTENIKNPLTDFFIVFGRVPLFYYFLHIFVLHVVAIIIGGNWRDMLLNDQNFKWVELGTYEFNLWIIYLAWIVLILALYPVCMWYMKYKSTHRDQWWLGYL